MAIVAGPSELGARPCPGPRPDAKPIVVGFAGWTLPFTSFRGSAVEQIVDRLRAGGTSAEVYPPDDWPDVAERLARRERSDGRIVLVGFSMGAAAAIHVAQKLGSVGIPVGNVVVVEAWNPEPIPANVAEATHFYSTRFAGPIRPGPGNGGAVENVDLNGRIPGIEDASHVAMSRMTVVQDLIIERLGLDRDQAETGHRAGGKAGSGCADRLVGPSRKVRPAPKP